MADEQKPEEEIPLDEPDEPEPPPTLPGEKKKEVPKFYEADSSFSAFDPERAIS